MSNEWDSGVKLITFAHLASRLPKKVSSKSVSFLSLMKQMIAAHPGEGGAPKAARKGNGKVKQRDPEAALRKQLNRQIQNDDISGATRMLTSNESMALFTAETLGELKKKHPIPLEMDFPEAPLFTSFPSVTPEEVLRAIKSFPNGSSGSFDGLTAQHLKDLTIFQRESKMFDRFHRVTHGDHGKRCSLGGSLPFLYGSLLVALSKKGAFCGVLPW